MAILGPLITPHINSIVWKLDLWKILYALRKLCLSFENLYKYFG